MHLMTDSVQILAWNGGGSGNYSDIVLQGGYTVRNSEASVAASGVKLSIIEDDLMAVEDMFVDEVKEVVDVVRDFFDEVVELEW